MPSWDKNFTVFRNILFFFFFAVVLKLWVEWITKKGKMQDRDLVIIGCWLDRGISECKFEVELKNLSRLNDWGSLAHATREKPVVSQELMHWGIIHNDIKSMFLQMMKIENVLRA